MKCTDKDMAFYPGFDLKATKKPFGFQYGEDVFGPEPEIRRLDDIRASLADPLSEGPDEVYAIVMDVGVKADREEIVKRNLLFVADPARCQELWEDFTP